MKKMKHLSAIILVLFLFSNLNAQERYFDERYISAQSFLNPVIINPGATGANKEHSLLLNYRNNWASFPGTPKSLILSYDGRVADRLGFGALLNTDSNGGLETTKFQGSLSYTIDAPVNRVGVGISAEYIQHGLDGEVLNNPIVNPDDGTIRSRLDGTNFFDVSVGLYGLYDSKLKYGVALPSLLSSRIDDGESSVEKEIGYIFHLGYMFTDLSKDLVLEPSLFVKKVMFVPFHADINLLGRFLDDKLRGGITYTVGADEKIGFLIGFGVNTLNFNYSYSASRNPFQTYNNGAHELSVRIDIGGSNRTANKAVDGENVMEEKMIKNN